MLHFLDFEASSLSDTSYPIEAGWASLDLSTGEITSEFMLIAPADDWDDWDLTSQAIHGIDRSLLITEGFTPKAVAQRMNKAMVGDVLCDGGEYDVHWNARLFEAAGQECAFNLQSYWVNLCSRMTGHGLGAERQIEVYQRFRAPRPHRAEPDASFLAELYRDCVTF